MDIQAQILIYMHILCTYTVLYSNILPYINIVDIMANLISYSATHRPRTTKSLSIDILKLWRK